MPSFGPYNIIGKGVLTGTDGRPCLMPLAGLETASVQVWVMSGTISTAVLKLQKTNSRQSPPADFASPVTLAPGTPSAVRACDSEYWAVNATTGEGSDVWVMVELSGRPGGAAVA